MQLVTSKIGAFVWAFIAVTNVNMIMETGHRRTLVHVPRHTYGRGLSALGPLKNPTFLALAQRGRDRHETSLLAIDRATHYASQRTSPSVASYYG